MKKGYNPKSIEAKWQKEWAKQGVYRQYDRKQKFYVLDMFPYPSGAGLHVGHPKGYIATDVVARMKQLQGYGVLHPMGWDAFGLPAEQYALKNKVHPEKAVRENIAIFKKQLRKIGFTYDWEREINTTDPAYYKWTQWIFLQMWKNGLAYESNDPVNWCPSCKTGLANEDLDSGRCERCGSVVEKRPLRQWVLRMTKYADRLLKDLDSKDLQWSESIKEQQRNWIGRSEGAEVIFPIAGTEGEVRVYTTRLDTIFGCTYVVVAPEHDLLRNQESRIENQSEVGKYLKKAAGKSDMERTELAKEKTGVKLEGIEAINPFTSERVPVYVADYVLGSYGTGAVMAVPAHDERDFEFAKKYGLPIKETIAPSFVLGGENVPKESVETLERDTVSAVIESADGKNILLLQDKKNVHFPGGGIERNETPEEAIRREIQEETGYTDIEIEGVVFNNLFCYGFRYTKQKNQKTKDIFFHVRLKSDQRTASEAEEGRHDVVWADRNKVDDAITWEHHRFVWKRFVDSVCFTEDGILVNSGEFTGLMSAEAREKMVAWLAKEKLGKKKVNYKMRDWTFSRQRYWGEPIPLIHCERCGIVPVPERELPLKLPKVKSYEPTDTGESPLANIAKWVNVKCPKCKGKAKRETNTMPQWAGSCWYYLRFIDPKNTKVFVDRKKEKKMMPVDVYVGGTEHATRHLLYARFWHKFLYDIKAVSGKEPFRKLVNQGLILASDGRKMSKRWGNVINPDDMVAEFGADAFRMYEMFMGPFTQSIAWNTDGVVGMKRFLDRVWILVDEIVKAQRDAKKIKSKSIDQTVKKVSEDIEHFRFNTAISSLMIYFNNRDFAGKINGQGIVEDHNIDMEALEKFLILLSPFAPHIAEELWAKLGNKRSVFLAQWPKYDARLLKSETANVAVQINGKLRAVLVVETGSDEETVKTMAFADPKVMAHIEGKEIRKVIYVPDKILNIVTA